MEQPIDFFQWIPIFPLPNAVLMPRAILPLHVFERRYQLMAGDALAGSRLIAIALLKPGFEANYDRQDVEIHREVCVGRILREEQLSDGRYNFLLQGIARARLIREDRDLEYRRGRLQAIRPILAQPDVECAARREIRRLLGGSSLTRLARQANWLELLKCPDFTLSDTVDVLASAALPSPEDKQRFLAEPSVAIRAASICNVLKAIAEQMEHRDRIAGSARQWPPEICRN